VLKLDIDSLPEGHSHQDLQEDASELDVVLDGGRLDSPVAVSLDIDRSGDQILLGGRATVEAELECARCLKPYAHVLGAPIQMAVIVGDVEEGAEREGLIQVARGTRYVDLADEIRGELLVRLPLKPLCKKDCRGLCPACGTDLNGGQCSCGSASSDPRWEALKRLKQDQ
jgi:uncharacterized protein